MTDQPEIYPMPSFAMLRVADLGASARWYQEALGFQHIFTMPGPGGGPGLVHLRWVKYADLLLTGRDAPEGPRGGGVSLHFSAYLAGRTVDAIAAQATAAGATIVAPPATMPWNARECTVADPDGYRLRVHGAGGHWAQLRIRCCVRRRSRGRRAGSGLRFACPVRMLHGKEVRWARAVGPEGPARCAPGGLLS